jgi:molybdopterin converting factor small subunit
LATVFIPTGLRALCGGEDRVEVVASDVRELIARLAERFPGVRERLGEAVAVAIDGEIVQDPLLEPVGPESEVHFLPAISGG